MLGAFLAMAIAIQGAPAQQRNDKRTWYQAYADAQRDVQQKNWQTAIADIEAASRLGAPKPGRNVLFYGDVYRDFNPDYYLGIAYLNLSRYDDADRAFERVKQAQLVAPRDSFYAEFTRQATTVKDFLEKQAASQRLANVNQNPPPTPSIGTAPPIAIPTPAAVAGGQPKNVPVPPDSVLPLPTGQPGQNSYQGTNQQSTISQRGDRQAPTSKGPPPRATSRVKPTNAAGPATGNAIPLVPLAPADERSALVDYFSGRYEIAATKLSALAATPNASPRAHFYLACSRAALALTGQANATAAMTDARTQLALARDAGQFAADKALISPRIKQALGMQP